MTKPAAPRKKAPPPAPEVVPPVPVAPLWRRGLRLALRVVAGFYIVIFGLVLMFRFINPPVTITMVADMWRTDVTRDWVRMDEIAPVLARSVVAAEDADFCLHWGFDMKAIRAALDEGRGRGASTISQQVVKNVFLWQGRSWLRKALEASITPMVELVWPKRRILEVYLNVAEMGDGIFGAEAISEAAFGVSASELTAAQAARIAVVLPDPKDRNPARLGSSLRRIAARVQDGAETIRVDGRSACFED